MPIDSTHPMYDKFHDLWKTCRDAVEGDEAIKAAGTRYLPMLSGHAKKGMDGLAAYEAYKKRALWFGATERTLTGYIGAIMRQDPIIKVPDAIAERLKDITDARQSAVEFTHTLCKELMTTGRYGLLVDKTETDEPAFVKLYYPENIINWGMDKDDLLWVVLTECVLAQDPNDPYKQEEIQQIRVLKLTELGYMVELYQKIDENWEPIPVDQPIFRGMPMTEIPFTFVSIDEDAVSCSKPPILDLAKCNINHYQLDADYRHGLHFTALPTPVFTGVDEDKEYFLGSEGAVNLRNENSRAFFLEFQGQGLTQVREALEERKTQLASLGAQLLSRKTGGRTVETAEAARIQHSGETSLLSIVVGRVEASIKWAFQKICVWEGILAEDTDTEEVTVSINRDFIDTKLDSNEIIALVTAWQNHAITDEILFWNFQRGGVINAETKFEEYKAGIAAKAQDAMKQAMAVSAAKAPPQPPDASGGGEGTPPQPKGGGQSGERPGA